MKRHHKLTAKQKAERRKRQDARAEANRQLAERNRIHMEEWNRRAILFRKFEPIPKPKIDMATGPCRAVLLIGAAYGESTMRRAMIIAEMLARSHPEVLVCHETPKPPMRSLSDIIDLVEHPPGSLLLTGISDPE